VTEVVVSVVNEPQVLLWKDIELVATMVLQMLETATRQEEVLSFRMEASGGSGI